jgi:hypothetical protein
LDTLSKEEGSYIVPRRSKEKEDKGVVLPLGPSAARSPRAAGGVAALHRRLHRHLLRPGHRLSPLGRHISIIIYNTCSSSLL